MTPRSDLLSSSVLIVDDEPMIRSEIVWRFGREGFTSLHEAASGHDALAFHRSQGADLVITDIRMANGSGLELMEELRRNASGPLPVILAMTAYSDLTLQEAYGKHVDAFFQKPFRLDDLVSASMHFLGLRKELARGTSALQALSFIDEMGQALTLTNMRLQRLSNTWSRGEIDAQEGMATLEHVLVQNRQVLRFLAELRERLQTSPTHIHARFDLVETVQSELALFKPRFEQCHATVRLQIRAGLPPVHGDAVLIGHAVHAIFESVLGVVRRESPSELVVSLDTSGDKIVLTCECLRPEGVAPGATAHVPRGELPDAIVERIALSHGGHFARQGCERGEFLVFMLPIRE